MQDRCHPQRMEDPRLHSSERWCEEEEWSMWSLEYSYFLLSLKSITIWTFRALFGHRLKANRRWLVNKHHLACDLLCIVRPSYSWNKKVLYAFRNQQHMNEKLLMSPSSVACSTTESDRTNPRPTVGLPHIVSPLFVR